MRGSFTANGRPRPITADGQCHVADRGTTWPIFINSQLPMPQPRAQPCMPQLLVDEWHEQANRCALSGEPPAVLALQLNRFHVSHGTCTKILSRVSLSNSLSIPHFVHPLDRIALGLEENVINYRLIAALVHYGDEPTAGHYRSVLVKEHRQYLTDDQRPSTLIKPNQISEVESNVYVLLFHRTL